MMDKNDILYNLYFGFQWGTNTGADDKKVDSEYTSQQAQVIKHIKGIKFLPDNKVESYIDFWHFNNKEIAGAAASTWTGTAYAIWPAEPWEITGASERL